MIISSLLSAQEKGDYQWLFGYNYHPDPGIESYKYDFNGDTMEIEADIGIGLEFRGSNTSICDENGDLLFYTNGCQVANRHHELMPNGIGINEGYFIEEFLNGNCEGYLGVQEIIALQDPANWTGYYIIHKSVEYDTVINELYLNQLRYSYIDLLWRHTKQALLALVILIKMNL